MVALLGGLGVPKVFRHHASTAIKSCYIGCIRWNALLKCTVSCFSAFSMTDEEPPIITASTSILTRLPLIVLRVTIIIVVILRAWNTWLTLLVVQKESKTWVSLAHWFKHRSIVISPPKKGTIKNMKILYPMILLAQCLTNPHARLINSIQTNTTNQKLFENVRNCCLKWHN